MRDAVNKGGKTRKTRICFKADYDAMDACALDALSGGAENRVADMTFCVSSVQHQLVMLPFRLFRNLKFAARSQIVRLQRPPLATSLLLRSHLPLAVRHNSTRVPPVSALGSAPSTTTSDAQAARSVVDEPRLSLTFTCTAGNCSTRSTHQFTKRAYEKGIVLIECPGCKTR